MELAGVFSIAGFLLLAIGSAMLLPMAVSLVYHEPVWSAFLVGAIITWLVGGLMFYIFRNQEQRSLRAREGLAVVGLTWIAASLMSSLPLFFSGEFVSYTDALFEACSGLTSTGATLLRDVESASHGVLFWRAMTNWLGGMGFIVLSLAVFPFLGLGGMQLYKSEIPSPNPERLQPRIKDTASSLWRIYLGFTLAAWLVLWLCGMGSFDAICHAMATMSSGGFSTKNASIGAFNSPLIEWALIFFMLVAGLNFAQLFWMLRRKPMWRDFEMRCYFSIVIVCALGVCLALICTTETSLANALRNSLFHVVSLVTTTGFSSENYIVWPSVALVFLMLPMLCSGSAGSTSGGPKILRWIILIKFLVNELKQVVHPRSVTAIKINQRPLEADIIKGVCGFFGLYATGLILATLALAIMGVDLGNAFSSALGCLGNLGTGLVDAEQAVSYADLPMVSKWLLCLAMIMGRLELFPVLVLFMPSFWRH